MRKTIYAAVGNEVVPIRTIEGVIIPARPERVEWPETPNDQKN